MGEDDDLDDEMNQQQLAASTPNVKKHKSFPSAVIDDLQNTTKNSHISGKRNPSQARKHSFNFTLEDNFGDVNEHE